MSMSSDEVNFLVYRYLQESGKFTDRNINQSLNRIIKNYLRYIKLTAFCRLTSECFFIVTEIYAKNLNIIYSDYAGLYRKFKILFNISFYYMV